MANTRDKNSSANYCLEQKGLERIRENLLFVNGAGGQAYRTNFPELLDNGRVSYNQLSCNGIDIESHLRGIGSNNLVNPRKDLDAKIKNISSINFFERPEMISIQKVNQDTSQRPFIIR